MNANNVLLRRNKILVPVSAETNQNLSAAATFNQNLQTLGYTLAPEALYEVAKLPLIEMASFLADTTKILKELRGVARYSPMYPNFPKQVMEASDCELYVNAMVHYFTAWVADNTGLDCIWLPKYKKDHRNPLDEKIQLTVLRPATQLSLFDLTASIVASNTSISPADKSDLVWLITNGFFAIPETVPNKENLALIGATFISYCGKTLSGASEFALSRFVKTATDVLRLAVAMSDGDMSLAKPTKFRSFKRWERRLLLEMLDNIPAASRNEDMQRHGGRWIRLAHGLHSSEWAHRFPGSAFSITALRDGEAVKTFNSKVEKAVRSANMTEAVKLLSQRPGEFARRLDHMLRLSDEKQTGIVLKSFLFVASQVSTPVLLQTMTHFNYRTDGGLRVVFPKGNISKIQAISNDLLPIKEDVALEVVSICETALHNRFATLPALVKVYVDPDLSDYLVPFAMRSANKSLRTLVRGSKVKFSTEKDTLRFFIWWKNPEKKQDSGGTWGDAWSTRTDLDLSAVMYDEDWKLKEYVTYYNLRSGYNQKTGGYGSCHSGDITDAPNGACEFIDIDMPSILNYGGRYVVMTVNSFTHQKFVELGECKAGWMLRDKVQSGEVFDARTVQNKIDIANDGTTVVMPFIIDCLERKIIWTDMGVTENRRYVSNVHGNIDSLTLIGQAFNEIKKPNLYDLFNIHAKARGVIVSNPEDADTVFSVANDTPYNLEVIASEYMTDAKPVAKTVSA